MNLLPYDGFYFLPDKNNNLDLSFFEFDGELAGGIKIDSHNKLGDIWQIAFYKQNNLGIPVFDDSFEAVIGNPEEYIMGLIGSGLYGCIVRKTDKSIQWFKNYIEGLRIVK